MDQKEEQKNAADVSPLYEDYYDEEESVGLKIKRTLKIILILLVVVIVFGGIAFGAYSIFGKKEQKEVMLTYWGLWEDEKVMRSVLDEFERLSPNIKVAYSKQDPDDYRDRLLTRIKKGTGPDIFRYHNTWLIMLSGKLLPLPNDIISGDDLKKNYYPVVANDLVLNGALYGVPLEIDTLSLFINKELLGTQGLTAPRTWDEFLNSARSLTVPDAETEKIVTAGAAIGTFDNISHAPDIISLLFIQNGADIKNLTSTMQNSVDALDFYTLFAKGEDKVWDETLEKSITSFAGGKVAMIFGYSWDAITLKAMAPDLVFEVHPVPRLAGGKQITIANYWVEGVSKDTKHPKEAFLLMKFLAKKETQQKLFTEESKVRLFGEPYSRADLAPLLKDNPIIYPFVQQGKEAVSSVFIGETKDNGINAELNTYLGNAIRSILANTSTQTAVETLAQGVTQVLGQYQETTSKN